MDPPADFGFSDAELAAAFDGLSRRGDVTGAGITRSGVILLFALSALLAETIEDPALCDALLVVLETAGRNYLVADSPGHSGE